MFIKRYKLFSIFLIIVSIFIYKYFSCLVPISNIDKNDKYYVNELYLSDSFAYENLDDETRRLYDLIFYSTRDYESKFTINNSDYDCDSGDDCSTKVLDAFYAVLVEHPELINMSSARWKYDDSTLTYSSSFATHGKLLDWIAIEKIKRDIYRIKRNTYNMSDIEKVRYVYDWMSSNKYDHIFTISSNNQSIYNVFINHHAVCSGFAKASQIIFQNIGIKSYIVRGYSTGEHMWNIVEVDGEYYKFDSSVATVYSRNYSGFYSGLNQKFMSDYQAYHSEWYPKLSDKEIFTKK